MAIPFAYNFRSVMRRPWSTLATALGIGLVVAILILALALANGFQHSLVETGSASNALVMRTGADSELSSGIDRGGASILRGLPRSPPGPRPAAVQLRPGRAHQPGSEGRQRLFQRHHPRRRSRRHRPPGPGEDRRRACLHPGRERAHGRQEDRTTASSASAWASGSSWPTPVRRRRPLHRRRLGVRVRGLGRRRHPLARLARAAASRA